MIAKGLLLFVVLRLTCYTSSIFFKLTKHTNSYLDIKKAYKIINKRRKGNLPLAIPYGNNLTLDSFIRLTFKGNTFIDVADDSESEVGDENLNVNPPIQDQDEQDEPVQIIPLAAQEPVDIHVIQNQVNEPLIIFRCGRSSLLM